jgi:DNA-binding response OmpR family regulator
VTLLVVEDEARIASFLVKGLSGQGYRVEAVATGTEALVRASDPGIDLVILDLGLADMDGLQVLRHLRRKGPEPPVIILTARGEVGDRIEGFDLGADDYLTKPFAFDELLARVRTRLRSRDGDAASRELAGMRLDPHARRVELRDESISLTEREYALLETFFRHPNETLSREALLSEVWGLEFDPGTNVVDVYVGYLRRKLGGNCIETVRHVGYRLSAGGLTYPA